MGGWRVMDSLVCIASWAPRLIMAAQVAAQPATVVTAHFASPLACPCPPRCARLAAPAVPCSGMLILVYARNHLKDDIGEVTTASVACGVLGVGGNKGAVAVEFSVHRRKIAVVCSHFAAHQVRVASSWRGGLLGRAQTVPCNTRGAAVWWWRGPAQTEPNYISLMVHALCPTVWSMWPDVCCRALWRLAMPTTPPSAGS